MYLNACAYVYIMCTVRVRNTKTKRLTRGQRRLVSVAECLAGDPCLLLVDEPGGRMADTLADAARPFALTHGACSTCWRTGMSCANG